MVEQDERRRARRSDGEQTYALILDKAVGLASVEGFGALTIGRLAEEVGVSKSGLYAHFGSKQRLQQDVIEAAREIFEREVVQPSLQAPEGLARLMALCEAYLSYVERGVFPGGCFFAGMLAEFDAQSGTTHDEVVTDQREWVGLLEQLAAAARDRGELAAATDVSQLAFEITGAVQLANYYRMLFDDPEAVQRARAAVDAAVARAVPARDVGA